MITIRRAAQLAILALLWFNLASVGTLARPETIVRAQICHYEAIVTLGDAAGYLRNTPIGSYVITSCTGPADLANQAAAAEAQIRATWEANTRKTTP